MRSLNDIPEYTLLPFRFCRLQGKEVLVNDVGDYLIVPDGTVRCMVERSLSVGSGLYKDLVSRSFIAPKPMSPLLAERLAARLRTTKSFLEHFTALHIVVPTLRCNQHCSYCQASSRNDRSAGCDMTPEMIDRAVDLVFCSPSPELTLEFQGGEPTLAAPLIMRAVERAIYINNVRARRRLTFVVCSNCIDFPDELLDFCKQHSVLVSTSLDGPAFLHDSNRGEAGNYEKTLRGIEKVRSVLGHDAVSALMTASELSLAHPHEIIDAYRESGFRRIFLRALNPYGSAARNADLRGYATRFMEFYKSAFEYILQLNLQGEFFAEEYATLFLQRMLTPFGTGYVDLQSPAGMVNSVALYHFDGKVYASDEGRMLAQMGDDRFCLGSLEDDYTSLFYGSKVQRWSRLWATEYIAGCSDCAWLPYCGADPVRNYTTQGDEYGFRPSSLFCERNRLVIEYLFTLLMQRGDELLPVFKSWIMR